MMVIPAKKVKKKKKKDVIYSVMQVIKTLPSWGLNCERIRCRKCPPLRKKGLQTLTLNVPCISESCIERKIKLKFLFSHFFVTPQIAKACKAFIKPFEAPQRSAKIKI